jgi:hypothetical protein
MARYSFTSQLNPEAIRALVTSPGGGVAQDLLRRGLLVETAAKRNLGGTPAAPKRVDTGRLRSSISTRLTMEQGQPVVSVGTNVYYAWFIHEGTGIYGPRHRVITPVRRRVMKFRPKVQRPGRRPGRGGFVYTRRVIGMRPNHFLRDALVAARG